MDCFLCYTVWLLNYSLEARMILDCACASHIAMVSVVNRVIEFRDV